MNSDLLLALVVITALAFDFTNGFHDTGNAMATSIATGALPPRVAVLLSGALNLVGAFLSFSVAATIASGLVSTGLINLTVVLAGLCGGITWNLLTWYFGIPSSSSHALIGGVIGATIAAAGSHAVKWQGLVSKVIIPGMLSPFIALGIAAIGTWWVYRITQGVAKGTRIARVPDRPDRLGVHGVARPRHQRRPEDHGHHHPGPRFRRGAGERVEGAGLGDRFGALAISLGTWLGGWRVIRTMGKGLTEIESPQGMAAEASSASAILLLQPLWLLVVDHPGGHWIHPRVRSGSAHRSTVERGGSDGLRVDRDHARGRRGGGSRLRDRQRHRRQRRWRRGLLDAVIAIGSVFFLLSRKTKVTPDNVNADWTGHVGGLAPTEPVAVCRWA